MTRRRRTFERARALLIGALVLGVGASATLAAWNDEEHATAEITAGTFSIVSRTAAQPDFGQHDEAADAVTMQFNATGLYPGQRRAAWIQITTDGTVAGTVQLSDADAGVTGEAGVALAAAMDVRIVTTTTTAPGQAPTCTPSTTGGVTYTGLGSMPTGLNPQQLAANGATAVNYCFVLTLRDDAPNAAQGGAATPTWTFTGTTG